MHASATAETIRFWVVVRVRVTIRQRHRHTPRGRMCVARRLLYGINSATSAA